MAQEAKRRRQTQRAAERLARAPAFVLIEEEEAEDSDDSGIDVEDGKEGRMGQGARLICRRVILSTPRARAP